MAAAAVFSSRAVSGLSTTKGLFLIFTLLCLVCFSSSLTDKDQLAKIKEDHQIALQRMEELKATMKAFKDFTKQRTSELNVMIEHTEEELEKTTKIFECLEKHHTEL